MNPLVFFTIVSRNYLAYALTLMQSVAERHPDPKRCLCLDDDRADDPALDTELFEAVTIDQFGLPDFEAFVFRYDVMELDTAVKPYMFEWLRMRHTHAGLAYFDPAFMCCGRSRKSRRHSRRQARRSDASYQRPVGWLGRRSA